jgi:hypothetical protein
VGLFDRLLGKKRQLASLSPAGMPKPRPVTSLPGEPVSQRQKTGPCAGRVPGIDLLIKVCLNRRYRLLGLKDDPLFNQAVEELKREEAIGARALASLIDELLAARCIEILDALEAASRLSPQPQLVNAIERVISAPPVVTSQTLNTRFSPVIVGGGRMGWDDGTASRIKQRAKEALRSLGVEPPEARDEGVRREASHSVAGAALEAGKERSVVVTCDGCQKTYRLGIDAAVVTSEGVAAEFMAVIVVGADKITGGTQDDPDLVAPYAEGRSPDGKVLAEVKRLINVRASRQPRYWRCNPCGKTNRYPW